MTEKSGSGVDQESSTARTESPASGLIPEPTDNDWLDSETEQLIRGVASAHRDAAWYWHGQEGYAGVFTQLRRRIRELQSQSREDGFVAAKAEVAARLVSGGVRGSIRV